MNTTDGPLRMNKREGQSVRFNVEQDFDLTTGKLIDEFEKLY